MLATAAMRPTLGSYRDGGLRQKNVYMPGALSVADMWLWSPNKSKFAAQFIASATERDACSFLFIVQNATTQSTIAKGVRAVPSRFCRFFLGMNTNARLFIGREYQLWHVAYLYRSEQLSEMNAETHFIGFIRVFFCFGSLGSFFSK